MTNPLALVIEDDPALSQIFTLTLSETFEVEALTDGMRALARLAETLPHLVILDLHLPGASGTQILHAIRADARLEATKVILATADAHQAEMLQDKADIILLKPISPMQLRDFAARLK
jgi:CheY-like chemotaxis protein